MITPHQNLIDAINCLAPVKGVTHNFYKYPCRFSPQFAKAVISQLSSPGDNVFDPFMGGGTAIIEAITLGRFATGVDLNELAHFVTKVKTVPISQSDKEKIIEWMDNTIDLEIKLPANDDKRLFNLPTHIANLFNIWLNAVELLTLPRQKNFIRCALLRTGQWAIDCRANIPTYNEIRVALRQNINTMFQEMDTLVSECKKIGIAKHKITSMRNLACRSVVGIEKDINFAGWQSRPRLVITSPPYPQVHVLYHRWQVNGRRETPAPYWLTGLNDGHGPSYYTFGNRHTKRGLEKYFDTLLQAFLSIKEIIHPEAYVVQLVAFGNTQAHLSLYLEVMSKAGFIEENLCVEENTRVSRKIPNRKWYSNIKGEDRDSTKEFFLVHRPR